MKVENIIKGGNKVNNLLEWDMVVDENGNLRISCNAEEVLVVYSNDNPSFFSNVINKLTDNKCDIYKN